MSDISDAGHPYARQNQRLYESPVTEQTLNTGRGHPCHLDTAQIQEIQEEYRKSVCNATAPANPAGAVYESISERYPFRV